jgi:hypothetical protein
MPDRQDAAHRTAERLSEQVNTPSTSAMENNENDLQLKIDKQVVTEESSAILELEDARRYLHKSSEPAGREQPVWFDTVHGAAMTAKASFPDQIDYYDPEADDII